VRCYNNLDIFRILILNLALVFIINIGVSAESINAYSVNGTKMNFKNSSGGEYYRSNDSNFVACKIQKEAFSGATPCYYNIDLNKCSATNQNGYVQDTNNSCKAGCKESLVKTDKIKITLSGATFNEIPSLDCDSKKNTCVISCILGQDILKIPKTPYCNDNLVKIDCGSEKTINCKIPPKIASANIDITCPPSQYRAYDNTNNKFVCKQAVFYSSYVPPKQNPTLVVINEPQPILNGGSGKPQHPVQLPSCANGCFLAPNNTCSCPITKPPVGCAAHNNGVATCCVRAGFDMPCPIS
jgi:hypothetical protein